MKSTARIGVGAILFIAFIAITWAISSNGLQAQPLNQPSPPSTAVQSSAPVEAKLSRPVSELSTGTSPQLDREINTLKNPGLFQEDLGLTGTDTHKQDGLAALSQLETGTTAAPIFTFEGLGTDGFTPPDTVGEVGPNHYVQMVNVSFAIFDKSGNTLQADTAFTELFVGSGLTACATENNGDPIVVYDELADRWLLSQFAVDSGNRMCIAISQTPDPTGAFYLYQFDMPDFPDYFKFGVWPDAYYMSTNTGFTNAYYAYAFDRTAMLAGNPATFQYSDGHPNFMMPADLDGETPPPAGSPGYFYTMLSDGYPNHPSGVDRLAFYEFDVDWATPGNSTFAMTQEFPIAAYNYTVCGFFVGDCIDQPGTAQGLDSLSYWPMFRFGYRNLGSYQALVGNFTVDLDGTDKAAIRWFELQNSGSGWGLHQEGTHAPDSDHRWMGSIAMDGSGNIGLGYSVSSDTTVPQIRYATRLRTDPLGTLQAEEIMYASGGVHTGTHRWGDYSALSVDPADDCTFWYTNQYDTSDNSGFDWHTRIGTFKIPGCTGELGPTGTVTGLIDNGTTGIASALASATNISGTLNSTANANGYYTMTLPIGNYDVAASAYGYIPSSSTPITVITGTTTVQDFTLVAAPTATLDGVVTDAATGWPLYASIDISGDGGYPGTTIWTDPATGAYDITLVTGITYTLDVDAWVTGYDSYNADLYLSATTTHDVDMVANTLACNAPGYVNTTSCLPPADGGLVVGHVYDSTSSTAINGATVTGSDDSMMTVPTPADTAIDDGFYTLFSLSGSQTFTATMDFFSDAIDPVTIVNGNTVTHDFYLESSHPVVDQNSLEITLTVGLSATLPLTVSNTGDGTLAFEWVEANSGYTPPSLFPIPPSNGNFERSNVPTSFTTAPATASSMQVDGIQSPLAGEPAYGVDLTASELANIPDTTAPGTWNSIGSVSGNSLYAGDFLNGDFTQEYVLSDANNLYSMDSTTAVLTLIGSATPDGGQTWTGMSGAANGVMYASSTDCSASTLYTIDVSTGVVTTIGAVSNAACLIDIAINTAGELYGLDIINDNLLSIDPATGAGTIIGSIGFDASFAQSMDVEEGTNILYLAAYNASLSQGELRIADTTTGNTVLVGAFPGGAEVDAFAFATGGGGGDVPWLSEDPISSTVASLANESVDITFDAGVPETTQPGDYEATLKLTNNSPVGTIDVPVTMHVVPGPTTAVISGTISSLGHCDINPAGLDGAEVFIQSNLGEEWTALTDVNGNYSLYVDETSAPLTISSSYLEHNTETETGIPLTGSETTIVDIALTWLQPCADVTVPQDLDVVLDWGDSTTLPLSIGNAGAASMSFEWSDSETGYIIAAPTAADVLIVAEDPTAAAAMEASLTALGYTYMEVDNTTYTSMPVGDLLAYGAVFYAGIPSSGTEQTQSMAYMDAGGNFFVADNDFGYNYGTDTMSTEYLQATYISDDGADGVLTGTDIMAGINPDISSDPWPDDFTVGAEGTEIFEAPSGNSAGVKIDRNGYKAIYLSFDYDEIASDADDLAIMEQIVGHLLFTDAPWMWTSILNGTMAQYTPPTNIDLTFNSTYVSAPGTYYGLVKVDTNDPVTPTYTYPVTMTVNPLSPDTGILKGTITDLGYCDVNPALLAGVDVVIEGSSGMTWTVQTDDNGYYGLFVDQTENTVAVTVAPNGYISQSAMVDVIGGDRVVQDFDLRRAEPCITTDPADLEVTLLLSHTLTTSLTIINSGALSTTYELTESDGGYISSTMQVTVNMPATTGAITTDGLRQASSEVRSAESFLVPMGLQPGSSIDVLILTPDTDVSDLDAALTAFPDIQVTTYAGDLSTLTAAELAPYAVVITTNNTQWAANAVQVGNALADHIDGGGKVIANSFAYDYAGWELAGRFIDEQYGPFTMTTTDNSGTSSLGTVHEPGHPIMAGVSTITNNYLWQNPGIATGATLIADWDDGTPFLAVNDNVVALNMLPSDGNGVSGWTGDAPTLYHNAIIWLVGSGDIPWLSENPITGTITADSSLQVQLVFDATVVTQTGDYTGSLYVGSADAGGRLEIPVVMHVVNDITIYLPVIMKPAVPTTVDLVVDSINMTADSVEVTIHNNGTEATSTGFWVDLYINPTTPPSGINQTWVINGGEGIVWGIDTPLAAGNSLMLTLSSPSYSTGESNFSGTIATGSSVYAQVDAAGDSTYGAILESDETNNIVGPIFAPTVATIPATFMNTLFSDALMALRR